jgi:carbamoyltransferase
MIPKPMERAGFKLFGHDSSVFYINSERKELFGLDTERTTRIKHDYGMPLEATRILSESLGVDEICMVVGSSYVNYFGSYPPLWTDPQLRKLFWERKSQGLGWFLKSAARKPSLLFHAPAAAVFKYVSRVARPVVGRRFGEYGERRTLNGLMKGSGVKFNGMEHVDHHLAHAASAYYFSPYRKALAVTLDGQGDWSSSKVFDCSSGKMEFLCGVDFDQRSYESFGAVYSRITSLLGLIPSSDEGKVEALAAYGEPHNKFYEFLDRNTKINDDEGVGFSISSELRNLMLDGRALQGVREELGDKEMAAAVQLWLEEKGLAYFRAIAERKGKCNVVLAGGVFANVKLNMRLFEEAPLRNIYVFPAMGDNGLAPGSLAFRLAELGEDIDWLRNKEMPYWGPLYGRRDILDAMNKMGLAYEDLGDDWPGQVAEMVARGKIVGIYHGRMEYGPRALGNRSILADPRLKEVKNKINRVVKRRKWYQPFCPSILESERRRLFKKSYKNKHMTCAFMVKEKFWGEIPAVMHIDGTSRAQFVEKKDNTPYYKFLRALKQETGYGVTLNTSFNLHGRTIVMTPRDAITDFRDCNIDALVMEGYLIER